ncbi:hypothetical protein LCGC14_2626560 [marine sediment metagenome]|uniref:Uncharacterized protein n=1 Tax=marine sediment metagenome TaxID=412755 RepID=A0A0F9CCK4_9ZZZZ
MNKQELEHKLEQAIKDRATICKGFTEEIGNLQARLAEADKPKPKPKLRHGACGISASNDNKPFVIIKDNDDKKRSYYEEGGLMGCDGSSYLKENLQNYTILIPNIFTDLEAISEPLESFKVQCRCIGSDVLSVRLCKDDTRKNGRIIFSLCHETVYTNKDYLHDFILNLRCIEAFINKEKS